MNLEPLIKSGFLEKFVLNQLSPDEDAAIEKLRIEIPEVDAKIKELEISLLPITPEPIIEKSDSDLQYINNPENEIESSNILDIEPTKDEVNHQIGGTVIEEIKYDETPIILDEISEPNADSVVEPIQDVVSTPIVENEILEENQTEENKWAPNFNKNLTDEIKTDVIIENAQESNNTLEVISSTEPEITQDIDVLEQRIVHDAKPINVPDLTQSPIPTQSTDMKFKFLSIVASLIAILFGAASFYFYSKYEIATKQLSRLELENKKHIEKYSLASNELSAKEVELRILNDVDYKKLVLNTTDTAIKRAATIFWNNKTGKVYANVTKLPTLSSNQQYQLWAIKAGKPVDLGVITDTTTSLTSQKDIDKAEAFAITVEKTGGNATPTMEKMVVKAAM